VGIEFRMNNSRVGYLHSRQTMPSVEGVSDNFCFKHYNTF